MFVINHFFSALATVINIVLNAYIWIIMGRVIVSWVNADPYNPLVRFLHEATEPLLARLRRAMPFLSMGGIDFAPMLLILALIFLRGFLVPTLEQFSH